MLGSGVEIAAIYQRHVERGFTGVMLRSIAWHARSSLPPGKRQPFPGLHASESNIGSTALDIDSSVLHIQYRFGKSLSRVVC